MRLTVGELTIGLLLSFFGANTQGKKKDFKPSHN
jgi:hypothetical protein